MAQMFVKDPSEDLDYEFDFAGLTNGVTGATSDYLRDGETISSFDVQSDDDGLTVGDSSLTKNDTCVQVWLSGGTTQQNYRVTATIVTSLARTVERTIRIRVMDR